MESIRSVAIGFWFRQGRLHETDGEVGASHLLEHMVFKGTARRSAHDLAREIERVGGVLDAYTTHETTAFQARVPAEHLALAMDVLSDLAFRPVLRESDLAVEREVVLEEIEAIEDAPEEVAFEQHAAFLYGGHPYGEPIIGTRETVSAMSSETLRALHRRAYRASNLVIAAAGAVEHSDLLELVERHIPATTTDRLGAQDFRIAGQTGLQRIERPGGRQTHLVAGCLGVSYRDPLRYAVIATSTALGGGMSSRLFQRIREDRGLAYTVYSFHGFFAAGGHVGAYVSTRPAAAERAREVLLAELDELAREGLRPDELEDTRTQLKGEMVISLESPSTRMNRLAAVALFDEPYRTVGGVMELIDGVDAEQCAAAATLFDPSRAAVLELSPGVDRGGRRPGRDMEADVHEPEGLTQERCE